MRGTALLGNRATVVWLGLALCLSAMAHAAIGASEAHAPARAPLGPLWRAAYSQQGARNTASAFAVDSSGNIFVSGTSRIGFDYTTARVTKTACTTVKYGPEGVLLWEATYTEPSTVTESQATLAPGGDIVVAARASFSSFTSDLVVIRYDGETGAERWRTRYVDPDGWIITTVAKPCLDESGHVNVLGTQAKEYEVKSLCLELDGANGAIRWTTQPGADPNRRSLGERMTIDESGTLYAVLSTVDANGENEAPILTRLDGATGAEVWRSLLPGPSQAVHLLPDGVVVGCGSRIIKFSRSSGEVLWNSPFEVPAAGESTLSDLVTSAAGDLYATGFTTRSDRRSGLTISYNGSTGLPVWTATLAATARDSRENLALCLAEGGGVYVGGYIDAANGTSSSALAKYDASGNAVWGHIYATPGQGNPWSLWVGTDPSGNIYCGGRLGYKSSLGAFLVLKYASNGVAPPPSPRTAQPTATLSEVYRDRTYCEDGFCVPIPAEALRFTASTTLQGVDPTTFQADTRVQIDMGNFHFNRSLGADPQYSPGRQTFRFVEYDYATNGRRVPVLTVTLTWPRGKLRVNTASSNFYEETVFAEAFYGRPNQSIRGGGVARISLGEFTQEYVLPASGTVTTRTVGPEYTKISSVTLKATGIPLN